MEAEAGEYEGKVFDELLGSSHRCKASVEAAKLKAQHRMGAW